MSVQGTKAAFGPGANEDDAASLTSRVYSRLRRDIIEGVLLPGTKLKVQQLVESYGSGASPIREALSLLTSDQLVERLDNRGFRVSHVSRRDLLELFEVRSWIEERALRRSVAEGDDGWEDNLVTTRFRLSKSARSVMLEGDDGSPKSEWEVWHKRFHMALIGGANSAIVLRLCSQLYDQNVRYRHIAGRVASPGRRVEDEHEAIAEAALGRDADLAVSLLLAHYRKTVDCLLDVLPED